MLGPGAASLDNRDGFAASSISAVHRDWLKGLPPMMTLDDDLFLCHGPPGGDDDYWLHRGKPGAMRKATLDEIIPHATSHGLALCGNTHVSRRVTLGDGRIIANPGSVGLPAFDDHELAPAHMGPVIPQACYLIAELNAEGWRVTLRTVAYDIERAARRAEANGRFGWAYTLRTGKRRQRFIRALFVFIKYIDKIHCGTYQVPEVCLAITAAKKSTIPIAYTMNEFNR